MKFDLTKIELEREDLDILHDVIIETLGYDWENGITDEKIIEWWIKVPDNIKLKTLQRGISDTEVRDDICVWLQKQFS